ncbi:MAG: orotidine-5'-phosphate decarboxylase, partial [Pseudomonas sp.]
MGSRRGAGSATMRADFDLPESPLMSACQTPIIVALD